MIRTKLFLFQFIKTTVNLELRLRFEPLKADPLLVSGLWNHSQIILHLEKLATDTPLWT